MNNILTSPAHMLTSPAYMAVPGNIYNTVLMDDDDENDGLSRYDTNNYVAGDGLLVSLVVLAALTLAFFIGMSNGGK